MITYYKAVSRDYTTGGYDGRPLVTWRAGETVTHPTSNRMVKGNPLTYLSWAVEPGETLLAGPIPCRLLAVEPIGEVILNPTHEYMRCGLSCLVLSELEPWRALGPNGRACAALIDQIKTMNRQAIRKINAIPHTTERSSAVAASVEVSHHFALGAARRAVMGEVLAVTQIAGKGVAVAHAAGAVAVRGLFPQEQYDLLTKPLFDEIGEPETWPVPAWCDLDSGEQT